MHPLTRLSLIAAWLADTSAAEQVVPAHLDSSQWVEAPVSEVLFVEYRWHDAKSIEPLFSFGFGLSYTGFALSNLRLSSSPDRESEVVVNCDVLNTGERLGAEVVQVYVEPKQPSVIRPVRELRGFAKVSLAPGEKKPVTITLTPRSFAYYSTERKSWVAEAGDYAIRVGGSSRDLPLTAPWKLSATQAVE